MAELWQTGRPHVEAHPVLDFAAALRNWRRGKSGLLWRNAQGGAIGSGAVDWLSPTLLSFRYVIQDIDYLNGSTNEVQFNIEHLGPVENLQRPHGKCQECGKFVRLVAFRNLEWFCLSCQGLRNRSSLIGSNVRISEKLANLDHKVGVGRPKNMRQKTYEDLNQKRTDLRDRLGGSFATANREFLDLVSVEWVSAGLHFDDHFRAAMIAKEQ
jgi:hypothetical protein